MQLHHAVEEAIHTSAGPLRVLLHHVRSECGLSAAQVSEGTQERGFTLGNGQHLIAQGFNVLRQDFCVGDCLLRSVDEELDDGLSIACTVVGERLNVPVSIVQQPGGDGQNHVASDAAGEQERGDEGSSGSAVAVSERVDRFKLGVRDSRLCEGVNIAAVHEGYKVFEGGRNPLVMRCHIVGGYRRITLNPHPLGAEYTGVLLQAAGQFAVHREDIIDANVLCGVQGCTHGVNIARHQLGVNADLRPACTQDSQ